MNAIDVSQTMRGLANMRLGSRLLVQALVHRAATILDTFNTQVGLTLSYGMHCSCKEREVYAGEHHTVHSPAQPSPGCCVVDLPGCQFGMSSVVSSCIYDSQSSICGLFQPCNYSAFCHMNVMQGWLLMKL